jgi:Zn-finger nucleic acid-binding protein
MLGTADGATDTRRQNSCWQCKIELRTNRRDNVSLNYCNCCCGTGRHDRKEMSPYDSQDSHEH